jgi:AraC-like DNA-binding protein
MSIRVRALFLRDTAPGWNVATHAHHGAWQWYACLRGKLDIEAGGVDVRLPPWSSVVVRPGAQRRLRTGASASSYAVAIVEAADLDLGSIAHRRLDAPSAQRQALRDLESELRLGGIDGQAMGEALLVRLLIGLKRTARPAAADETPPGRHPAVAAAEEFLARHAHRRVSRAEVAAAAGVSQPHLARLFRAERGLSVLHAALHLRLQRAKDLLGGSDLPVAAVALETGFASFSHFASAFRQLAGCSPTAYRQRLAARPPAVR